MNEAYADVPAIRLVLDNLNTHRLASLYETFPAPGARRIAKRLEFHYTPEHGIGLNPVPSLPTGWQRSSSACWPGLVCGRGRNADVDRPEGAVNACVSQRNATAATINWRFTAKDARTKLRRLCPCHS